MVQRYWNVMKRGICLLLFVTIGASIALAQADSLRGRVVSQEEEPLVSMNVVALSLADSSYLASTLTDEEGYFTLEEPSAAYFLHFSGLGYKSANAEPQPDMLVQLETDVQQLDEVVVTANRVQSTPRGYAYSFENNPKTKGRKGMDVIAMLPNVSYESGDLKILGREVSAIYIDNVKVDLKELESLRAQEIENVEVDYSAAGSEDVTSLGGVLRVKRRPLERNGVRGVVSAETSYFPVYTIFWGNIYNTITTKIDKVSINNALYMSHSTYHSEDERKVIQGDSTHTTWDKYYEPTPYFSDRVRLSYQINPQNVLSVSGFYAYDYRTPKYTTSFPETDIPELVTKGKKKRHIAQAVVNYALTLEEDSFEITGDYYWRDNRDNQYPAQKDETFSHQVNHMVRVKPVYAHTFNQIMAQLSVGGDFKMVDLVEGASSNVVPADMRAYVPAVYTTFEGQAGMCMYSVGVRYQYNWLATMQGNATYTHRFGSVYPSFSLQYLMNPEKGHMLMLMSERGANQIPYSVISGYRVYESAQFYTVGNPQIVTPTLWQNMLMFQLWGQLSLSAMYMYVKTPIEFARHADPTNENVLYLQPYNGKNQHALFFSIEWKRQLLKWWELKLSTSAGLHYANMGEGNLKVKNQLLPCSFNMHNNFMFTDYMGGGLSGHFETQAHYIDRTLKPVGHVKGYFFSTFLEDALELRLDALFYSHGRVVITETPDFKFIESDKCHNYSIELSLTYNFQVGKKFNTSPFSRAIQDYEKIESMY